MLWKWCPLQVNSKPTEPTLLESQQKVNRHTARSHVLPMLRFGPCLASLILAAALPAAELYVSTRGDDRWSGNLAAPNLERSDGPFATLEAARDRIRQMKANQSINEPLFVFLRGGVYELANTFALNSRDSGAPDMPVTYRAYPNETATLSGGRELKKFVKTTDPTIASRLPSSARDRVWYTDLKSIGITNFGEATAAGNRAELFFDGQPMTLARWPNAGFVRVKEVIGGKPITVHGITGDAIGKFTYEGDRPNRWMKENDLWLHGYWFWDWSDAFQKVQSIDTDEGTIDLTPPYHGYGYRNGQRYYALNAISELDSEGEWHLDRGQGILYFWPPEAPENHRAVFSVLPTLVSLKGASWITFQNLAFEATRDTAVKIEGGTHNSVSGCRLSDIGGWAVSVGSGSESGVSDCEIFQVGEGGVSLSGGDRKALSASGHYCENNHIRKFGRIFRTYRPAVSVSGVGVRVTHNLIHDGPHNAIQLSGNDHLIEYNEIHNVCYETGDVGAFYMGRDWTARGTVIRHNYFHDIHGPGLHGAMAVYLDDSASGITIYGNVFYRAGRAAFIGGGRDNRIENNIFVECNPSVHVDARGLGWMRYHVDKDGILPERLAAMPYKLPPWSNRFPELVNILQDSPGAPKGNRIKRNISFGGTWKNIEKAAASLVEFKDNLIDQDPKFVSIKEENFQLQDHSPAFQLGFKRIPVEQIGLKNK